MKQTDTYNSIEGKLVKKGQTDKTKTKNKIPATLKHGMI